MTSNKKTFVVDVDGTICNNTDGDYESAQPFLDRIEVINKIHELGHNIIYHTARGMGRTNNDAKEATKRFYELTFKQLVSWGCKFDMLVLGKPAGAYYIDDKAILADDFFRELKEVI